MSLSKYSLILDVLHESKKETSLNKKRYDTRCVISIDSSLLSSMRNGKNVTFRGRKMGITSPSP